MGSFTSLRRRLLAILFPAVLVLPSVLIAQTDVVASLDGAERYLLAAANHERMLAGRALLQRDPMLDRAATSHAIEMAKREDISHGFPGEPDLVARATRAGVHVSLICENVGQSDDAADIHIMWMRSAGHRENLLDPEVSAVGISVVIRDGELYAVEDFAGSGRIAAIKQGRVDVGNLVNQREKPIATPPMAIQAMVRRNVTAKKVLMENLAQRAVTPSVTPGQ